MIDISQKVAIFYKLSTGVIIQIIFKVNAQISNVKSITRIGDEHVRT